MMKDSERMGLFKQIGKIEGLNYEGMVITKIKYQCVPAMSSSQAYCTFEKRSPKITVVTCCHTFQNVQQKITLQLFTPPKITLASEGLHRTTIDGQSVSNGEPWTQFSKDEIQRFSHETGDTNSIHLGEQPVVQGLLILMKLQEKFREALSEGDLDQGIEIKFLHPIYGDEPVYLVCNGKYFQGFSRGTLCFEAKTENPINPINQKEDKENE